MTTKIGPPRNWAFLHLVMLSFPLYAVSISVSAFDPGVPAKLSRLAINNSVFADFKFSPDGKTVVYRARATLDGDRDLFSVPVTGGEPTNLTSNVAGDVSGIFTISNDSSKIVYKLFDPQGEPVLRLSTVPTSTGFFVNKVLSGSFINAPTAINKLLISSDSSHVVYRAQTTLTPGFRLYSTPLVAPFQNEPTMVAGNGSELNKQVSDFQFVPAQKRIIYLGNLDELGKRELYTGRSEAYQGREKLNVTLASGHNVSTFNVSPDGNYAVYIADGRVAGLNELYSTSLLVPEFNKLNSDTIASTEDIFNFKISPNSQHVVYQSNERNVARRELYSVPINNNGGGQSKLISTDLPQNGDVLTSYKISPNSTRVVYLADLVDEHFELFSTFISSRNTIPLTPSIGSDDVVTNFSFDKSGASVVYELVNTKSVPSVTNIYSARVAGGVNISLSPTGSGMFISSREVHPELDRVFYLADQRHDRLFELFSSKVAGPSSTSRVINTPLSEFSEKEVSEYAVSDDGKFLVYLADQDIVGKRELYSVNLDAGGLCFPIKALNSKVVTICL